MVETNNSTNAFTEITYDKEAKSIVIPIGVTEIKDFEFSGFSVLESITIPNTVTKIWDYAFKDCRSLKNVIIPESVDTIGEFAFSGCKSLKNIIIPESITIIRESTFYMCESLESITIPKSVKVIESMVFIGCQALQRICVDSDNQYYCSIDGVLFSKDRTSIILFPKKHPQVHYQIPFFVNKIEDGAFSFSNQKNIVIPNSVTYIGFDAFYHCESIQSITIPDTVSEIKIGTFRGCTSLKEIVIPNSVTKIKRNAFYGCKSLQNIIIPKSVKEIEKSVFIGCTSLHSIHMLHKKPPKKLVIQTFDDFIFENCTLYVPGNAQKKYRNHPVFGKFRYIEIESKLNRNILKKSWLCILKFLRSK